MILLQAPEVLDSDSYDWSADVYSFGITLWEICMQQKPYEDLMLTAMQVDPHWLPDLLQAHPKCTL